MGPKNWQEKCVIIQIHRSFQQQVVKKKLGHTRSVIGEPLKFPGRDVDVFPLTNFLKGLKVTQVAVKGPFLL